MLVKYILRKFCCFTPVLCTVRGEGKVRGGGDGGGGGGGGDDVEISEEEMKKKRRMIRR